MCSFGSHRIQQLLFDATCQSKVGIANHYLEDKHLTKVTNIKLVDSIKHEPIVCSCQDVRGCTGVNYHDRSQN